MIVEWHDEKAKRNFSKHKISLEEAATVFDDPLHSTIPDPDHSTTEQRLLTIGHSAKERLFVLSHVYRGDKIRLINARKPTRNERLDYEEER